MVGHAVVLGLLAVAPAAPPVRSTTISPPPIPPVSSADATAYTVNVLAIAKRVREEFATLGLHDLTAAAVSGLYGAVGADVPPGLKETLAGDLTEAACRELLTRARLSLGDPPALAGPRAFVASVTALSRAADPYCGLALDRRPGVLTFDPEFGLGFELDGASGPDWMLYYLDLGHSGTRRSADNGRAAVPKPPIPVPWRVRRVVPGSPAAAAGLRTGDLITEYRSTAVTAESSAELVPELVRLGEPLREGRSATAGEKPADLAIMVSRPGESGPLKLKLRVTAYEPETVFGYSRADAAGWHLFPRPETKFGYIRLGPLDTSTIERFQELLAQLAEENAVGLVLDLRWNPGGYVTPAYQIAGAFLKPDQLIAKVKYRRTDRQPERDPYPPAAAGREWAMAVPMVVLVNAETTGGGEMIAAALQDHKRALVVGQRTAGKASVVSTYPSGVRGLSYRVTTGQTFRPSEKPRQRHPDSGPGDDWGVRPDPGCEIPTTPVFSRTLRDWADWQACRPAGSREALPFDDPLTDPQRLIAEKVLLGVIRLKK